MATLNSLFYNFHKISSLLSGTTHRVIKCLPLFVFGSTLGKSSSCTLLKASSYLLQISSSQNTLSTFFALCALCTKFWQNPSTKLLEKIFYRLHYFCLLLLLDFIIKRQSEQTTTHRFCYQKLPFLAPHRAAYQRKVEGKVMKYG